MDKIRALAQQIGMSADKAQYLAEVFGEDDFTNVIAPSLKRRKAADSAIASTGIAYKGQRSTTPSMAELLDLHARNKAAINDLSAKIEASGQKNNTELDRLAGAARQALNDLRAYLQSIADNREAIQEVARELNAVLDEIGAKYYSGIDYDTMFPGLYTSDQERKTKAQQDAANEKAMRRAIPGMYAKSDDDSGVDYSRIFPGLYDKK